MMLNLGKLYTLEHISTLSSWNHTVKKTALLQSISSCATTKLAAETSFLGSYSSAFLPMLLFFSRSVMSDSLRPHRLRPARLPCSSPTPGVYSNSCPLSRWYHPTISSSVVLPAPAFSLSQHQGLYKWVSSSHQVAKGLEFQLQHQSFQWIPRTDLL